jgi:hypothetical protein
MFSTKNGLKQGDNASPLLFNSALDYSIRRVQVNQNGLNLYGTHLHLINADAVKTLGGIIHTIKENTVASEFASKERGLEAIDDKTKFTVKSRDHNAGR